MRIKPHYAVQMDPDKLEQTVERLADSVSKSLDSIVKSEIIAGDILENIELSTTPTRVSHKLGRKPLGFIVIRINANATVYESLEPRQDLFLNLTATADVTVSLWIF